MSPACLEIKGNKTRRKSPKCKCCHSKGMQLQNERFANSQKVQVIIVPMFGTFNTAYCISAVLPSMDKQAFQKLVHPLKTGPDLFLVMNRIYQSSGGPFFKYKQFSSPKQVQNKRSYKTDSASNHSWCLHKRAILFFLTALSNSSASGGPGLIFQNLQAL